MLRRVLAALAAVILALVGAYLVINYATAADQRAQEGLETHDALVVTDRVPAGTPAAEMSDHVELRSLPLAALPEGAVDDLGDLGDLVTNAELVPGEALVQARFTTAEQQRAEGAVPLPEGTEDLHQVTLLLDKARALGGNVTRGDTVGVFLSFEVEETGEDTEGRRTQVSHLTLHKVPVVRVEGAVVTPEQAASPDEGQTAEESIFVTLALEARDAERLVYGMEWGQVWLSLEPDGAEEDTEVVIIQFPTSGQEVFQ